MSELILIDEPECELHEETKDTISLVGLFAGIQKLVEELSAIYVDEIIENMQNVWQRVREVFIRILEKFTDLRTTERIKRNRSYLHALFMAAICFVIAKPITLMFAENSMLIRFIYLLKHQDRGPNASELTKLTLCN